MAIYKILLITLDKKRTIKCIKDKNRIMYSNKIKK